MSFTGRRSLWRTMYRGGRRRRLMHCRCRTCNKWGEGRQAHGWQQCARGATARAGGWRTNPAGMLTWQSAVSFSQHGSQQFQKQLRTKRGPGLQAGRAFLWSLSSAKSSQSMQRSSTRSTNASAASRPCSVGRGRPCLLTHYAMPGAAAGRHALGQPGTVGSHPTLMHHCSPATTNCNTFLPASQQ